MHFQAIIITNTGIVEANLGSFTFSGIRTYKYIVKKIRYESGLACAWTRALLNAPRRVQNSLSLVKGRRAKAMYRSARTQCAVSYK